MTGVADRLTFRDALRLALVDDRDGPLPALLVGFTMLGGVVDAVSILSLDHVFVATITGNVVFIGLGLVGAGGFSVVSPVVAVAGFLVGVIAGAPLCRRSGGHRGRAVRNVAAWKATLAVPVNIIVVFATEPLHPGVRLTITVLLAASMGAQLTLIRYIRVPDLVTVLITLTMIGVITERGRDRHDPVRYRRTLSILAFAVGVVSGGALAQYVFPGVALLLGLVIILVVGVISHLVSRDEASWSALP